MEVHVVEEEFATLMIQVNHVQVSPTSASDALDLYVD